MKLQLSDAGATARLGEVLAGMLEPQAGGVLYLEGDLGAGKTTLARALLRRLGIRGGIRSPTYTLLEPYQLDGRNAIHLDLYRLNDPRELHNLGLDDYPPAQTLWLVEWPERGLAFLPAADITVRLAHEGAARVADICWPARESELGKISALIQKSP